MLQCDEHQAYAHPEVKRKAGRSGGGEGAGASARLGGGRCNEEKLRGVRHFCEVLMNRCFPSHGVWEEMHHGGGGGGARRYEVGAKGGGAGGGAAGTDEAAARLHEYFVRHHCDLLTCEAGGVIENESSTDVESINSSFSPSAYSSFSSSSSSFPSSFPSSPYSSSSSSFSLISFSSHACIHEHSP